jgi:hypothetical protein
MTRTLYDLDDVKRRADVAREVADRSGAGKVSGSTITYRCPNPSHPDTHPSFTVKTTTGAWGCWSRCDAHGTGAIDLVMWLDGCDLADAVEYLGDKYRADRRTNSSSTNRHRRPSTPAMKPKPTPRLVTTPEDTARTIPQDSAQRILDRFLAGRGWSAETAEMLGLSVVVDRYGRPRVRVPFLLDGTAHLWQDRATEPEQSPKWLTPSDAVLYPLGVDCLRRYDGPADTWPTCPIVGCPAVWIVEGPADAVTLLNLWPTLSVLGLPGATSWKPHYSTALSGLVVVVITDNDPAGTTLRATLNDELGNLCAVVNVPVPETVNDLGEWYQVAGWETFCAELLNAVDAAADAEAARS